jgi:hypothetical protein
MMTLFYRHHTKVLIAMGCLAILFLPPVHAWAQG